MLRFAVALGLTAVLAAPASAEVVASSEAGFVTKHVVDVPASPAEVWKALTAPSGWWASEHTYSGDAANLYIDAQATGCFCELLPLPADAPEGTRRGSIEHMHIIYAEPGRVLRLSGGLGPLQSEAVTGTLTITLKALPAGGTRIQWFYVVGGYARFKFPEIAVTVEKVLGEQAKRLAVKLGGVESGAEAAPDEAKPKPAG
jgi:uncharacterized protein YndB with AHSA1/START domain